LGAHLIQALGGTKTGEGMALGDQFIRILLVDRTALALPVRAVRAADIRTLVPFDAQPAQGVEDLLFGLASRTQLISIFDSQNEFTTVLAGETQIEQGDIGGADVRVASRRRRNTGADFGHDKSREQIRWIKARC